jgi:uncharacterized surface protein with fasciclin (FAS1) repeats
MTCQHLFHFKHMNLNLKFSALLLSALLAACTFGGCNPGTTTPAAATDTAAPAAGGQANVQDDDSQKDVVKTAIGSPDHTTLVTAVKAAGLVDVLSNAGPFTVFAPTNVAFEALPKGTVEDLLKPANKAALTNVLEYHVAVAVYKPEMLRDGQILNMVNGGNIQINREGDEIRVNGQAKIVASIPASNGIIHVLDGVLLPR